MDVETEESPPTNLLDFGKYWWSRLKDLTERKDQLILIITMVAAAIGALVSSFIPGLLPQPLESTLAFWIEVCAVLAIIVHTLLWPSYVEVRLLESRNATLSSQIKELRTPKISISCGESEIGSVARNSPVSHFIQLHGNHKQSYVIKTDFFGVVLRNEGITLIENLTATLTQIERVGHGEVWSNKFALAFEPLSRTEKEPVESIDLPHNRPHSFCLCSIDEAETIMASSLNMTLRHAGFRELFSEPGDFIFCVTLSAKNIPSMNVKFLFKWAGNRRQSRISQFNK